MISGCDKRARPSRILAQSLEQCRRRCASLNLDSGATVRITQAHKGEIQIQQSRQEVHQVGRDGLRLSTHPQRRNRGQRNQIPQSFLKGELVSVRIRRQRSTFSVRHASLTHLIQKLLGGDEEGIFPQ